MSALDFLQRVLPAGDYWYAGHCKNAVGVIQHKSFKTLEELVRFLQRWDRLGYDCYFSVAAFELGGISYIDNGREKYHYRTRDNKPWLMNFHGDIDTKITHEKTAHYETHYEATNALIAFCGRHELPLPWLIDSGGGVQFYWHGTRLLPADDWEILARGLKATMLEEGLQIDPNPAADPVRVLRVPGSRHQKLTKKWGRDVHVTVRREAEDVDFAIFEQFRQKGLESEPTRREPRHSTPEHQLRPGSIAGAIAGGSGDDLSSYEAIAQRCGQLAQLKAEPGSAREAVHRAVAGFSKFGGDLDVYLSWLSPEYVEQGRQKAAGWTSHGPATCGYFKDQYPERCEGCPYQVTSPLQLGRFTDTPRVRQTRQVRPAPALLEARPAFERESSSDGMNGFPVLSKPWSMDKKGRIIMATESADGDPVNITISDHLLYVESVHTSEATGYASITFKHKLPNQPWDTFNIDSETLADAALSRKLLRNGVSVRDPKHMREYVLDQMRDCDDKAARTLRFEQCGWKGIDTATPAFLHGQNLYCGGKCAPAVVGDDLAKLVRDGITPTVGGSAREMVVIMRQLFDPDHKVAWFTIGSSYSSVSQVMLDPTAGGALINLFGPSGGGKSQITKAAISVWSKFDALSIKHYDTAPSMGRKLAAACHLPIGIDEIHHFLNRPTGMQDLRTFFDMFNAGTDKQRAQQFGVGLLRQNLRWSMNGITNANQELLDIIEVGGKPMDGQAVGKRLLEFRGDAPKPFDHIDGDALKRQFERHAGHCGDAFLRDLMQPGVLADYQASLEHTAKAIWRRTRWGSAERFRVNVLAGITATWPLLRSRGLVPHEITETDMLDWGIDQLQSSGLTTPIEVPSVEMAMEATSAFLRANACNTLRVEYAFKHGMSQPAIPPLPREVMMRHETQAGRLYIPRKEFRSHITNAGYPYKDVIKHLHEQSILIDDNKLVTLGAGTGYAAGQSRCLEFDANHPALSNNIREVPNANLRQSDPSLANIRPN